jgi:hypothetical protein
VRSTIIFFILCFIGYEAVQYYYDRPAAPPPAAVPRPKGAEPPTPAPTPEPPQSPDLRLVPVAGAHALTHARIKEVHESGIVFICDQGLVKVGFKQLPPEFQAFYGPMAAQETASQDTPAGASAVPSAPPPPPAPRPKPERTPIQDAQANLAYNQACAGLRDRLQNDQHVIDHWYNQSSFVQEGYVSETQFNVAKADFEAATAQLAELQASGP